MQINSPTPSIAQTGETNYLTYKFIGFCEASPNICETGKNVFYALGTRTRDGMRAIYLFFDKHFTNQPIEATDASY